jgi:hypothetical protein
MRARRLVPLALSAVLLGGCLGAPEIEDRWTRIDFESASLAPGQALPAGSAQAVNVRAAITYRRIVTGFAVAELRASSTVGTGSVEIHPDAEREPMASAIDYVLQNSVTVGRATRAVTGWDHLIQTIDFNFTGVAPATLDSTGAPAAGLFLVCYLGQGTEIELADGSDSLVVTPFPSGPFEILPVGLELLVAGPGSN